MHVELKVLFKTPQPLSQQAGMDMWSLGNHFKSQTGHGGCTYQLKSRGEADTVDGGIEGLKGHIKQVCNRYFDADRVQFLNVSGKETA